MRFFHWSILAKLSASLLSAVSGSKSDPKVVILMPYNGEIIMKVHLDSLFDVVDLFAIVEGKYTLSGLRKAKYSSHGNEKVSKLLKMQIS
jgi:hypothetical protein